jgi:hypothetical protein
MTYAVVGEERAAFTSRVDGWLVYMFEAAGFFEISVNHYRSMHLRIPDTAVFRVTTMRITYLIHYWYGY